MVLTRKIISLPAFESRHKTSKEAFSRDRKLSFNIVAVLLLRKSVKSLQIVLNDFCKQLGLQKVSASAFSQARRKFKHTAFIELLDTCILSVFYSDEDYQTYKGHRLLGVDGSKLRLPNSEEIAKEFGVITERNHKHETRYTEAKISVLYDLRNHLPLSGVMAKGRTGECKLASENLDKLQEGDIVICDRGYASYQFFCQIISKNAHFIIRCRRRWFQDGAGLFKAGGKNSKIATLECPKELSGQLPQSIKLRFVRVILENGETEVLITSLLDKEKYPNSDFRNLYHERWQVETFYNILKSRLCLENFTGRTVEAVKQDFYSTLYIAALESILIEDAQKNLNKKRTKRMQKVNKAVSFYVIKDKAFEILHDKSKTAEELNSELTILFQQNPTLLRPDRIKIRKKKTRNTHSWNSINFHRNLKKHVF